jgi:DNA primase
VENVVAASGTALTEDQVKLIRRFTDNVTVVFDGDDAGIRAAIRGIDLLLSGGLNVRVLQLPDGHDPDSFSKSTGTAALLQYLKDQSKDFISFKADLQVRDAGNDPVKRAESIRNIVQSIALIPDGLKRMVYIQETARLMGLGEGVLLSELNKVIIRDQRDRNRNEPPQFDIPVLTADAVAKEEALITGKTDPEKMVHDQERETLRLILNYAEEAIDETSLVDFLIHELEDVQFSNPTYGLIYSTICSGWMEGKKVSSTYLLENSTPEVSEAVTGLVTRKYEVSENWDKKYNIYIPKDKDVINALALGNINRLKFRVIQRMLRENLVKIGEAEKSGLSDQLEECLNRHQHLKEAEKELAGELGIVVAG